MAQTWHDLLFAHWPVETQAVRRLVPAELPLDAFEGHAWVGVDSLSHERNPRSRIAAASRTLALS